MSRVAIFVDAGYLFAQGSAALTGEKRPRSQIKLNETAVLAELAAVVKSKCDDVRLLRTYWYDAPLGSGMSAQQTILAQADGVKLRLGVLNMRGQQKGVDSLIVTDLIELARNNSICDAVLLSGDEDVRVGVQIAQNFGVAVHLVGIHPSRGSQSMLLRQEADSNTEWDKETVARFLTISPLAPQTPAASAAKGGKKETSETKPSERATVHGVIDEIVSAFDTDQIAELETYWASGASDIPPDIDRPLLAKCRDSLDRILTPDERREARVHFADRVKAIIKKAP